MLGVETMAHHPRIEARVSLAPLCTFRIGGAARYFSRAAADDIPFLVESARMRRLPIHVLGGGSNTICDDGIINRFVIKMEETGIRVVDDSRDKLIVEVAAGTPWDEFVVYAIERGAGGIEALSVIPGTAGAAPIQNIGAYGQEASQTIRRVRAFDTETELFVDIPAARCGFDYRTSVFKGPARGRFIITAVTFALSKQNPCMPPYPDIVRYFAERAEPHPSLANIRRAVIEIRARKLPDPAVIPNAGSFFENPVVPTEKYRELLESFPDMPSFALPDGGKKLPAGWLIDRCGFKGRWRGNAGVYEKNALVLVGNGKTTYRELMELRDEIVAGVRARFGITLEMEPNIVT